MIDAHPSYEVDLALECLIVEQYLACFWLLVGFFNFNSISEIFGETP